MHMLSMSLMHGRLISNRCVLHAPLQAPGMAVTGPTVAQLDASRAAGIGISGSQWKHVKLRMWGLFIIKRA